MQYIFYQVKLLFIISIFSFVFLQNIECQDKFIKRKPRILYKSTSDDSLLLEESSSDNKEIENISVNLDESEETIEPFIFTTSIPSVSPQPPGIALTIEDEFQTTTLDSLIANSMTTYSIPSSTTKDDFSLEDDESVEKDKTNNIETTSHSIIESSSSHNADLKKSEGVNSFDNSELNNQYVFSVPEEKIVLTTESSKLIENNELNNLDDKDFILIDSKTPTMSPVTVTDDFTSTTETTSINTTSMSSDIPFNTSDKFVINEYNTIVNEGNYTKKVKKSCPEIEICNPGCGISIDSDGCQRCTCLWIPKFCMETAECNGPEYICEYGKCLCNNNYTQDMERSGICIPKPDNLKQNEI
uniref:TIL domain-containing protein n=1 Tax=Strongyloides papillosus TaxID=174720 RepID=A0A0N5B6G6_STREA